jgi:hypothetical protein
MPPQNTGLKKKLTISPCEIQTNGNVTVDSGKKFDVMLNPSGYSHQHSISYNKKKTLGQLGSDAKFSAVNPEKVSFDIVIDGTGVVRPENPGQQLPDVKTQIQQLNDIVYKYDGNVHEPNHVRLLWGSFIFFGRLESMAVEYTLFKPSGDPLRAKVKLAFVGFMSKEEEVLRANRSSADLTHHVVVKAGDTLPLLCYRIYRDSAYYLEVARVNDIIDFRNLKPGATLHFPPLR